MNQIFEDSVNDQEYDDVLIVTRLKIASMGQYIGFDICMVAVILTCPIYTLFLPSV